MYLDLLPYDLRHVQQNAFECDGGGLYVVGTLHGTCDADLVGNRGAGLMTLAINQSAHVDRARNYVKAQSIAEAGVNYAYAVLREDFSKREDDNAFPSTEFGGGSYSVQVSPLGDKDAHIASVGTYEGVQCTVAVDVHNFGEGSPASGAEQPPAVGAYEYAVLSGDTMTWTGSGFTDVGDGKIHANGAYKMVGCSIGTGNLSSCVQIWATGTTQINGDAQAPKFKGKAPGNVSGTATKTSVDPVEIPDIDLQPYFLEAEGNGQVYNGNIHWSGSSDITIPGGILWINGDFQYSGSGDLTGCIIATGDIRMSGSGDQIQVSYYPAMISRDGDIKITGSSDLEGLILARNGDFEKHGSGKVVGSIMCAGTFKKTGSWDLMVYENATPVPPEGGGGDEGEDANLIAITAWHN